MLPAAGMVPAMAQKPIVTVMWIVLPNAAMAAAQAVKTVAAANKIAVGLVAANLVANQGKIAVIVQQIVQVAAAVRMDVRHYLGKPVRIVNQTAAPVHLAAIKNVILLKIVLRVIVTVVNVVPTANANRYF